MTEVGDGRIVKMEVDCSSMVDQKLPECQNMSKVVERCGSVSGTTRPEGRPRLCLVISGALRAIALTCGYRLAE